MKIYSALDNYSKNRNNEYVDIAQNHKEDLQKKIVESIISGLENNLLTKEELPVIADLVLEGMDKISSHEELTSFINELSLKWPIFLNIAKLEEGEKREQQEDKTTQQVLQLARNGQIDEAVNLAKTATSK
ncbi:MAG: hypothetical protein Q7S38_01670 [bacterium]|nr:hypothetical protein [bacterium]